MEDRYDELNAELIIASVVEQAELDDALLALLDNILLETGYLTLKDVAI